MTRADQIRAAVLQVLTAGACSFDGLVTGVRRAFPDATATEVDTAAREWERGEPGRYVYSLEALPQAQREAGEERQMALFAEES